MDQYELGDALAAERIAELRRHADRWRLASRIPGHSAGRCRDLAVRGRAAEEGAMLTGHLHEPGVFDAGHCRACASQAGLLDHYRRVQREEAQLQVTQEWAGMARRYAIVALGSSGTAILLAVVALLTG
jgi:hypothetical protein